MPGGSWRAAFALGFLVAVAALGSLEAFWRERGHRPSIRSDEALWALERDRVYDAGDGKRPVVFLGSSRILLGLSEAELARRHPELRPVVLAVDGAQPLAALRDLALDTSFRGLVVVDVHEYAFEPQEVESQERFVRYRRDRWTIAAAWDRRLSLLVQASFVVTLPELSPRQVLGCLRASGELPRPFYLRTLPSRTRAADYSLLDVAQHRAARIARTWSLLTRKPSYGPAPWLACALETDLWVMALRARGGEVVFFRAPSSGKSLEMEDAVYPRAAYWDQFAARTSAKTLHFREVPEFLELELPDTSHVDGRDRDRFTRALVLGLEAKGVL